jgi:hypothetical protein
VCSGVPDTLRLTAFPQSGQAMIGMYGARRRSTELQELAVAIALSMQTPATNASAALTPPPVHEGERGEGKFQLGILTERKGRGAD